MTIERFPKNSDYFFLSNMYPIGGGIEAEEGLRVPTAEHLYQASKFVDEFARLDVYAAADGYGAKNTASRLKSEGARIRGDWAPEVKVEVMKEILDRKFERNSKLARWLIERTGDQEIQEGNNWDDRFWGISPPGSGIGMNMLGRLLMDKRAELKKPQSQLLREAAGAGKSYSILFYKEPPKETSF